MNELSFRKWLFKNNFNSKVESDIVSRLKKILREVNVDDLDEEYRKDNCQYLLSLFKKKGEKMKSFNNDLPIGKYVLSAYKYALNTYIKYKKDLDGQE